MQIVSLFVLFVKRFPADDALGKRCLLVFMFKLVLLEAALQMNLQMFKPLCVSSL